jgi:hypothetical protein
MQDIDKQEGSAIYHHGLICAIAEQDSTRHDGDAADPPLSISKEHIQG